MLMSRFWISWPQIWLIELNIALVTCIVCANASASPLEDLVDCNGVTPLAILFYLLPEVLVYGDRDGCIYVATEVVIDTVTSFALPRLPASFIIVVCSKWIRCINKSKDLEKCFVIRAGEYV